MFRVQGGNAFDCLTWKVVCGTIDDSQEPEYHYFISLDDETQYICQDEFNECFLLRYQHMKHVESTDWQSGNYSSSFRFHLRAVYSDIVPWITLSNPHYECNAFYDKITKNANQPLTLIYSWKSASLTCFRFLSESQTIMRLQSSRWITDSRLTTFCLPALSPDFPLSRTILPWTITRPLTVAAYAGSSWFSLQP